MVTSGVRPYGEGQPGFLVREKLSDARKDLTKVVAHKHPEISWVRGTKVELMQVNINSVTGEVTDKKILRDAVVKF